MQLLLDQGLPRLTVQFLAELGVEAKHVGQIGLAAASDAEILTETIQRDAVLISLDSDFHALLAASGASSPSVIRIRIEGLDGEALAKLLVQVLAAVELELEAGAVVSVTEQRIRVRSLPIGRKVR
ncbi:MAG: DUF5615 family PIN-like protein [Pirellulales bacterium]|nr:DUF5615 family PIN-like protein [Pirellulales bacterium]